MENNMQENSLDKKKFETPTKKDGSSRTTFSLIAAFIVVLILVSVVAYRAGIDPIAVKQNIANFAQSLTQRYAKQGMDVKLEYSSLDIKGGIFEKSVLLKDVSIVAKGKGANYKISSPSAKVVPLDSHFEEFTIELEYPLNIDNDLRKIAYSSATPFKANFVLNEAGQREYVMPFPLEAKVEIKTGEVVKEYEVSNNDASFISGVFPTDDSDEYSVALAFEELKIVGENFESKVAAASLSAISTGNDGEFEFNLSQLSSNLLPEALGAIDVDLSQKSSVDSETKAKNMDIELFSISGDGFDGNLKGRAAFNEGELMPIANINVAINGISKVFAALGDAKYFTLKQKTITIEAIKLIAPEWNEFSLSPLQFDIRRDENAPFVIGKVKADELLAMVLSQYLQFEESVIKLDSPVEVAPAVEVAPSVEVTPDAEVETPKEAEENAQDFQPKAEAAPVAEPVVETPAVGSDKAK